MSLSWLSIVRLGAIQMAMGSVVVLTSSTFNRLMVVEIGLPAVLPGLLVALYHGIQITRPSWGFLSDTGGHRTRWIIGGMVTLALGALGAALAVVLFDSSFAGALALSIISYAMIGLGVGASGTTLLALLASATDPGRRAAAATITWLMMIGGIAVTALTVGSFLDPYTPGLLLRIVAVVTGGAVLLTGVAIAGIERRLSPTERPSEAARLIDGLREVWAEPKARNFTVFVFLSMTAYFMQELILEPYAGLVFGLTPGQSTQLSGIQNGGVFFGMLSVGVLATGLRFGSTRIWVIVGCIGSAVSLGAISLAGAAGATMAFVPSVVALGVFNGAFAVAAVASMMALAGEGRGAREGTRMGLWGAAQAIAAGGGGLLGAASVDVMRRILPDDTATAFGAVFLAEAVLFLAAAMLARAVVSVPQMRGDGPVTSR